MRFCNWKRRLYRKVHRTRNKCSYYFAPPISCSWYKNAEKQNLWERRRQFAQHCPTKLASYPNPEDELQILRQQYSALRTEQLQLERALKMRTIALIKAMHKHKNGMDKVEKLEQLIAVKVEELHNPQEIKNKLNVTKVNNAKVCTNENYAEDILGLVEDRSVGGADRNSESLREIWPDLAKSYITVLRFANRWLRKTKIRQRESGISIAHRQKVVEKPEKKEREILEKRKSSRISATKSNKSLISSGRSMEAIRRSEIEGHRKKSQMLKRSGSRSGKRRTTRTGRRRSRQSTDIDVDEPARSRVAGKRKRTKSRKSRQSTASDVDDRRDGRRGRKSRRRRSRKSIEGATPDVAQIRESQRRSKRSRKSTDKRRGSRRRSSRKSAEIKEESKRRSDAEKSTINAEKADEVGTLPEDKEKVNQKRRGSGRRKSADSKRASKNSRESSSPRRSVDGHQRARVSVKTVTGSNDAYEAKVETQSSKSGKSIKKHKERSSDKMSRDDVLGKKRLKSSATTSDFSILESYWGVSLRHSREDTSLKKLEALSSVLDDLINAGTQPYKHSRSVIARKTITSTKQKEREVNDLYKLLNLLKECQECQKKQENEQNLERKNQHIDIISRAAGMPDCLPDDYDYDMT